MNISKLIQLIILSLILVAVSDYAVFAQNRNLTSDHRVHEKFNSKFAKSRDLIVWLPPEYDKNTPQRYPTLYMHDGDSAFANWRLDETAAALIRDNQIVPMIIIYVPNGGSVDDRFIDYTPTRDARRAAPKIYPPAGPSSTCQSCPCPVRRHRTT